VTGAQVSVESVLIITLSWIRYVFVQYAGPAAPAVRRGRHVGQASFVKEAMGGAHATMVFSEPEDATVDAVLTRLLSIMTADDGEYSLADLKSLIEAQIAKAQLAADVGGDGRHVRTAAEMANHDFGWRECLKYVASSHGPFNWLLVEPNVDNPRLYNSGSGSVMEMVEWLDTSKVLYGLVRMSFGTGQFRRTKWVWLQWSGDDVGAMQRSRGVYGGVVEGMQVRNDRARRLRVTASVSPGKEGTGVQWAGDVSLTSLVGWTFG
jgi:hypothetical protein